MAVDEEKDRLRVALHEMEQLIVDAGRSGVPVERWIQQFVVELRAAFPEEPESEDSRIACRILSDPDASLVAQARLDPDAIKALKDLIVAGSR